MSFYPRQESMPGCQSCDGWLNASTKTLHPSKRVFETKAQEPKNAGGIVRPSFVHVLPGMEHDEAVSEKNKKITRSLSSHKVTMRLR